MPIYEYRCAKCEHTWSDLVSSSTSPLPACPDCKGKRVEKLFSVFAASTNEVPGADACATGPGPSCGPSNCGCGRFN